MLNLSDFFVTLATRAWKENDLSDVTFAMCEADPVFRQFFLDFFFPNAKLVGDEVSISREHSTPNGRPDFWIETLDGVSYIVEVKIWDGNHHFEQYYNILKDWSRLAYIANYSLENLTVNYGEKSLAVSKLGCRLATWKEFILRLEQYSCLNDSFIEAYLKYLKAVCPYDDFVIPNDWKVSTADFVSVANHIGIFERAINQDELKSLGVRLYTRSPRHFETKRKIGRFFEMELRGGDASLVAWGWIGIRYIRQGAYLCVEFEDRGGWGKPVCDKYRNADHIRNGMLRFYAKEDISGKEDAIKDFFREVLLSVNAGKMPQSDRIATSADDACSMKSLLPMKCLPIALEQMFQEESAVKPIADKGYGIKLGYKSDQEVPLSYCGRYFELTPCSSDTQTPQESPTTYSAWIGVIYADGCKRKTSRVSYKDKPSFVVELPVSFPRHAQMPEGWTENTWGWFSYEIEDGLLWRKALKKARAVLCEFLKA